MFDLNMPEVLDDELEEAAVQQSVHEEFEEQGERVSQSVPVSPTMQEVRDHAVCHMPYRSWCARCVRGRGRAPPHARIREAEDEKLRRRPRVSMDYFYLSKKKDDALPLLAIVDESTQRLFSLSLPCKGLGISTMWRL